MGLDTVELVMAVEEQFAIEIPDEIAATLETVGLLHGFVVSQLQRRSLLPIDDAAVFSKLRDIICEQTGIDPDRIVPDAYFVKDLHLD
jgi:acyl carrier protein